MSRYTEQKIRLLLLFEILQRETDDKHALTTNEIREKLKTYGIEATRQTVYDDIGEAQADSLKELLTVKSNELGNERV